MRCSERRQGKTTQQKDKQHNTTRPRQLFFKENPPQKTHKTHIILYGDAHHTVLIFWCDFGRQVMNTCTCTFHLHRVMVYSSASTATCTWKIMHYTSESSSTGRLMLLTLYMYLWRWGREFGCEGVKERSDISVQHGSKGSEHRADQVGNRREGGKQVLEHSYTRITGNKYNTLHTHSVIYYYISRKIECNAPCMQSM